jgi:hypothetical protein
MLPLIILLSFAAGLGLRWRSTIVIGPVAAVVYGASLVWNEAPTYDMHGLGYAVGVIGAFFALIVWLIGRWMRNLPPRRSP